MADVELRLVEDADLDVLFDLMHDPVSVQMAAFTPKAPGDRAQFDARASSDNAGSLRVLQKAGFTITHTDAGYANARDAEIEETCLRLG